MKKKAYLVVLLALMSFSLFPSRSEGGDIPKVTRPVNDYAGVITPAQENKIADLLIAHRKKTGVQAAVLTVRTTGKSSIEEFSLKAAEQWGGGSKERDDGLLLTVAVADRRMRIEVGYGLEGYITDLRAGRILDGIRGDFKKQNYGLGIEKAVKEIILHTESLRAGEEAPVSARLRGAFYHLFKYPLTGFIMGALIGALFLIMNQLMKFRIWITLVVSCIIFACIPVLLQLYVPGVWYWTPVVFFTGALAGASLGGVVGVQRLKWLAVTLNAIPAAISLGFIIYCLHVLKPVQDSTTEHETILLVVLLHTNIFQFVFLLLSIFDVFSDTGGSYSSGGSTSYSSSESYSSSSTGSSNDTSWSGGGGSYGGGGASSSW